MTEWKEQVSAAIWKPASEGEELEGEVTHVNPDGLYGAQHTIKTKDGEILTPSHKVLQNRLSRL